MKQDFLFYLVRFTALTDICGMNFQKLSKTPVIYILLIGHALLLSFSALHFHSINIHAPAAFYEKNESGSHGTYSDLSNCQLPRISQNLSVYYSSQGIPVAPLFPAENQVFEYPSQTFLFPNLTSVSLRAPPALS